MKGDTLEDALRTIGNPLFQLSLPNRVVEAPVGSTTVQFTEKPNLRAVETATVGAPPSAEAKWPEPTLGPMDGDRKRGEAGPGHRRRTNAQIAEDNLYLEQKARAEAALKEMDKGVHPEPGSEEWEDKKQREHDAAISSGEERVNPEDAADEAAETAARATDAPTLEDLRAAVAEYIGVHGVKASVDNMRAIVGCPIDKVPADEIANAIAKVKLATSGTTVVTPNSPADDTAVTPSAKAPEMEGLFSGERATATKEDVVEIMKVYGRKFDGSDDPEKMVVTKEDLPKVFTASSAPASPAWVRCRRRRPKRSARSGARFVMRWRRTVRAGDSAMSL